LHIKLNHPHNLNHPHIVILERSEGSASDLALAVACSTPSS
jgi:hypothetical protein